MGLYHTQLLDPPLLIFAFPSSTIPSSLTPSLSLSLYLRCTCKLCSLHRHRRDREPVGIVTAGVKIPGSSQTITGAAHTRRILSLLPPSFSDGPFLPLFRSPHFFYSARSIYLPRSFFLSISLSRSLTHTHTHTYTFFLYTSDIDLGEAWYSWHERTM